MPDSGHRAALACLVLVLLAGILFFGLRPKDLILSNNVNWLKDRNGLHFRKYGLAFSPPFIDPSDGGISEQKDLSIELAVKIKIQDSKAFRFLMALDNGDDSRQFVVGQWRAWLIVMNGDDYAHKRKLKRVSLDTTLLSGKILFLTIVLGADGTDVFVNGKPAAAKKDVLLKIPPGNRSRLILGNSAYGIHSWQGDVYGLAIYNRRLAADDVSENYRQWSGSQTFNYALAKHPLAVYFFDEKRGELARDRAGAAHLELPRRMKVLRRKLLALPWEDFEFNRDFVMDVAANFIAFVPFGFVLLAALSQMGARLKAGAFLTAVSIGILTSLFIEISQSWMPSRSSTLLDLILNSAGTVAGVTAYMIYARYRHRSKAKR